MRAINGFAVLCALGLLISDAIIGASIDRVVFHVALLAINFVFFTMGER